MINWCDLLDRDVLFVTSDQRLSRADQNIAYDHTDLAGTFKKWAP
jgi:hypothetical protein